MSVLIPALMAAAWSATCPSAIQPRTTAGLLAAERLWVAALQARDSHGLDCLLAKTFADNAWDGSVRGREDLLGALGSRPAASIELRGLTAKVIGAAGMVRGLSVSRGEVGQSARAARFTDIFVYENGRWIAIAAQETPAPPR